VRAETAAVRPPLDLAVAQRAAAVDLGAMVVHPIGLLVARWRREVGTDGGLDAAYAVFRDDLRQRVAERALQADGLALVVHVLAVMAAEAARKILVPDIVRKVLPGQV